MKQNLVQQLEGSTQEFIQAEKKQKTMLNIKEAYGNKYVVITYVVAKQWDEQGMETA